MERFGKEINGMGEKELAEKLQTVLADIRKKEQQIRKLDQDLARLQKQADKHKEQVKLYREAYGNLPQPCPPDKVSEYDWDRGFFEQLEQTRGKPCHPMQITAIRYPMDKHLRLIAGAGSGKTETICAKAVYLTTMERVEESRICMITFTREAVKQMQERVERLQEVESSRISFGTFYDVMNFLTEEVKRKFPSLQSVGIQGDNPEQGEQEYKKILSNLIQKYQLEVFDGYGEKSIYERISYWVKRSFSRKEIVEAIRKHYDCIESSSTIPISERFRLMMNECDEVRKKHHVIIYDDYLLNLYQLLQQSDEVREYVQGKFDYIIIDEFQDINPLQMAIIKHMSPPEKWKGPKLIIAGDDDQSIYTCLGSDPIYIKEFHEIFETETMELMINHRSKYNIVVAGNKLIARNAHDRIEKAMLPVHKQNGDAFIVVAENSQDEANWILDQVERLGLQRGLKHNEKTEKIEASIAVIYRSASQLQNLVQALVQRGIPYIFKNEQDASSIFYRPVEQSDQMLQPIEKYTNESNALLLLPIYDSKGLAYDHVFIIGAYDGGIPHARAVPLNRVNIRECQEKAETPIILEEERRLMYVAITRARKNLYITLPDKQKNRPVRRSLFINELRLPIKKRRVFS